SSILSHHPCAPVIYTPSLHDALPISLFGFQTYLTGGEKEGNPYTFTYVADEENGNQTKQDIEKIDQILEERAIEAKRVTTELEYYVTDDGTETLIASESMYNDFADLLGEKAIHLENNEIIGVRQSAAMMGGYVEDKF